MYFDVCLQYYYYSPSCVRVKRNSSTFPFRRKTPTRALSNTTKKAEPLNARCVSCVQIGGTMTLCYTVFLYLSQYVSQFWGGLSYCLFFFISAPLFPQHPYLLTPTSDVDVTDGLRQTTRQVLHLPIQPLIPLFVVDIFTDALLSAGMGEISGCVIRQSTNCQCFGKCSSCRKWLTAVTFFVVSCLSTWGKTR